MQHDAIVHTGFGVFSVHDASEQQQHGQAHTDASRARSAQRALPPLGPDNTNRPLIDLPPIVNRRLQYANKQLKYRPFPRDVDEVRDKLFRLEQPILLNSQQIADYWTHMSNIYMRSTKPTLEANGTVSESWECRNRRRTNESKKPRPSLGLRNRSNKSGALEVLACKVRMKVTTFTKHAKVCKGVGLFNCKCIPEWMYIDFTGRSRSNDLIHTHNIESCDEFKRSNALMYACKVKVEEGYNFQAVGKWMREKYGSIAKEIGYLSKQDISNVSRYWRMVNKDMELRTEVEEESPQASDRSACMDAIEISTPANLRKAMIEVCARLPQAIDIVRPYLDKPLQQDDADSKIMEGLDLEIPAPGLPSKKFRPEVTETHCSSQPSIQAVPAASSDLPRPLTPIVQGEGQPIPLEIHPLHIPTHLVDRYLHAQAHPQQLVASGEPAHRPFDKSFGSHYSSHGHFNTPSKTQTRYFNSYQLMARPASYPTPGPPSATNTIDSPRHGSTPDIRAQVDAIPRNQPSWATPHKRAAENGSTEQSRPSKRPKSANEVQTQLQREPSR